MLLRALTGRLTLGAALLILASIGIRQALRSHSRQEENAQAVVARYAPAMGLLTDAALADSHWRYRGAQGEFELHFAKDGRLQTRSASKATQGTWSIGAGMLSMAAPALGEPHQGIFRDSADELVGPDPAGSGSWSATRIR